MNFQLLNQFLDNLFADLKKENIDVSNFFLDHVCFRTESEADYLRTKEEFFEVGELLSETLVGGRLIASFKLQRPFIYHDRLIRVIEVPAPKAGSPYPRGFEHAEFAIPISFHQLFELYPSTHFKRPKNPGAFNAEVSLKLNQSNVKFHHLPLEAVIAIESNTQAWSALENYSIFEKLSEFSPLVSGSLPLKIETNLSDLDLLFSANDLDHFDRQATFIDNAQLKRVQLGHDLCSIWQFNYTGMDIEFVAMATPSAEQRAHRHLLIEARLLNIGGEKAIAAIKELKQKGMKTEPAFAHYFKITGDPYEELLEISLWSESKLFNAFRRFSDH
jgi:predicted metalloenzyme YecM